MLPTPSRAVTIALAATVISAGVWIFLPASRNRPMDRRISNVAWSGTGRWIAAGTSQGVITVSSGRPAPATRQVEFSRGPLNDLQFSPDERLLAVAGKDLGLFALEPLAMLRFLRSDGRNYGTVRFSHDRQSVLVITGRGTIEVLDGQSGAARLDICCSSVYGEIAFTPDERSIANAGHWPALWDSRSGQLIARLTKDRESYTFGPIAFDQTHGAILMGSQEGRVYCWDLATKQLIARSPAHSEYVNTIAVSSTGLVAYAGFGKIVRLWNPQTGQERSLAEAHPTSNLILGPDGASIIFGTADGEMEFWDTQEGRRTRTLRLPRN